MLTFFIQISSYSLKSCYIIWLYLISNTKEGFLITFFDELIFKHFSIRDQVQSNSWTSRHVNASLEQRSNLFQQNLRTFGEIKSDENLLFIFVFGRRHCVSVIRRFTQIIFWNHHFCTQKPTNFHKKRHLSLLKTTSLGILKSTGNSIWSHDAKKGWRKMLKIFLVPEMVNLLQHNTKKKWRQFQTTFFKFDPVGEFSPCQKFFFQSQNSNK